MPNEEPIRLFLWYDDGHPAGEWILAPGETRPTVIIRGTPEQRTEFWQDPRNADMYREHI